MVKSKGYLYSIILIMTGCLFHMDIMAQSVNNINLTEKFQIITDRTLYSSGERVYFAARETALSEHNGFQLSEVLNLDIITPEGQIITSSKHPVEKGYSIGSVRIPEEVLSGTYYLRCYTRWMRNYDNLQMTYISIRVINPSKNTQLPLKDIEENSHKLKPLHSESLPLDLKITSDKSVYHTREEVRLSLQGPSADIDSGPLTISVLPSGAESGQLKNNSQKDKVFPQEVSLLPETRGISISGKVRNRGSEDFEAFSPVFITLLDTERNFYPGISDSTGSFYFSLPGHHGTKDLFISVKDTEDKILEVLIDRDFTLDHSILPSYEISLDSMEYMAALNIVRNQQLRSQYYREEGQPGQQEVDSVFFYGIPSHSLKVNFYIDLPSLEEYFLELIPVVSISRSRGVAQFRINGPQAEMKIYDPLVMIDGVVIHDNEAVLKIDPGNIERIDIVDRPWLRGDIIFGGIISLHSRKNDFAGVDLPESGLFLSYRFFEPEHPLPQENIPFEDHMPDVRNTLYWDPDFKIQPGETREIRFKTGDTTGDYLILIRQIGPEGQILESTHRIRVE